MPGARPGRARVTVGRTLLARSDWVLAIEARVCALLRDAGAAESEYRESIARLGRTRLRVELARLAIAGRTNPEIGAELFIGPRTVGRHLKTVFMKLGIRSRKGLRDALPARGHAVATA